MQWTARIWCKGPTYNCSSKNIKSGITNSQTKTNEPFEAAIEVKFLTCERKHGQGKNWNKYITDIKISQFNHSGERWLDTSLPRFAKRAFLFNNTVPVKEAKIQRKLWEIIHTWIFTHWRLNICTLTEWSRTQTSSTDNNFLGRETPNTQFLESEKTFLSLC